MRPLGTFGICVLTGGKSPTVGGRGFIMGVGAGGTVITVRDCTLADSAAKSIVMMQSSLFDDVYVYAVDCDAAARELTHISDLSRPLSVHAVLCFPQCHC